MNILLSWLHDYIDIQETPEKIADALLMGGIEVESIHQPGRDIKNVVVGQILSIDPHPNAEKLVVCQVDVGKPEPLTIVCGAKNMKAGDKVPVAMVGARLPSGMEIRRAKIRGTESFGMMCSKTELGIGEDHSGLLILPPETTLGQDIVPLLGLDDVIFEISITPNRGDALSHLGIARELSAIFNLPIHRNALDTAEGEGDVHQVTSVTIDSPEMCPRYGARIIENVNDIVGTIAAAVEEQSVSSQEIATNISQASQGIEEVNQNVNQTSSVSTSISGDIAKVNQGVQDISLNSTLLNTKAGELGQLAAQLQQIVGRFKV